MKEKTHHFWKSHGKLIVMDCLAVLLSGIIRAVGIFMFVTPNHFAPGGTSGIAVLLEYATGWNSGIFLAIINVPLFFIAFFGLGKREAIVSTASMMLSSGLLMLFDPKVFPWVENVLYTPDYGFLAAVAGGIISGIALAIMIKCCGTSGGTSILASLVNKKYRNLSVSMLTSAFDATVVFVSFFVYNQGAASFTVKLDPVLLACVCLFVTSKMCDVILHGFKTAYKFEIVTDEPEALAEEI
ncbi:MAG: YitT family protein, partial [Clostridia bacterium]|nr:YitT family protein [Clostridia bacterium]